MLLTLASSELLRASPQLRRYNSGTMKCTLPVGTVQHRWHTVPAQLGFSHPKQFKSTDRSVVAN
jgi:hypothetical protein